MKIKTTKCNEREKVQVQSVGSRDRDKVGVKLEN